MRTAWSRHHRSGGFGIHSPSAYAFVREVLRQRLPYYAYGQLAAVRQAVVAATSHAERREMGLVSLSHARLLFRIANRVNPSVVVSVGTGGGLDTLAMLLVSRQSRAMVLDAEIERHAMTVQVLRPVLERVAWYDEGSVLADDVEALATGEEDAEERCMIVVNRVDDGQLPAVERLLRWGIEHECPMVVCGLQHDERMRQLWQACQQWMTAGHSFTNGKIAIALPISKLPRQHFELWL